MNIIKCWKPSLNIFSEPRSEDISQPNIQDNNLNTLFIFISNTKKIQNLKVDGEEETYRQEVRCEVVWRSEYWRVQPCHWVHLETEHTNTSAWSRGALLTRVWCFDLGGGGKSERRFCPNQMFEYLKTRRQSLKQIQDNNVNPNPFSLIPNPLCRV